MQLSDKKLLKTKAYINGEWLDGDGGDTFAVTDPATGDSIAEVASCGTAETRRAIEAAEAAMLTWRKRSVKDRAGILRKWFNLMMDAQEDLAQILTAEQGKPLAEARGEIAYGANYIEWFAEEGKRVYGDTIPAPSDDKRIVVLEFPECDADPKNRAGVSCRMHSRVQAGQRDTLVCFCLRRAG